ncbi:phytanoyl-CoA dioxygenase [Hymenobacter psoromatis]|nr:phytanoyl-CoA dioxygenase [Hymenobacter psoromatis]
MNIPFDKLPTLAEIEPLAAAQIQEFRTLGHTLTRGVLSPAEVAAYRAVIEQAADRYNTEARPLAARDTYGKAFLQIMNLWRADEDVRRFVLARRFAQLAADLLGVENVRIYHDQALFKEPGGGPTPWHQDQYYWPVDTTNTITMWMPLVDIDVAMGMLTFASGSHHQGEVFDYEISDDSAAAYEDYVRAQGFPIAQAATMRAGDATWHYGNTIHQAPGNASAQMREVMTIIYVADGARVVAPAHKWQHNDHAKWLRHLPAGELVASELNPLVL